MPEEMIDTTQSEEQQEEQGSSESVEQEGQTEGQAEVEGEQPQEVVSQQQPQAVELPPSPYAGIEPSNEVPRELQEYFDPEAFKAMDAYLQRQVDERVHLALRAQAQSRQAARALGLPQHLAEEYAEPMQRNEFVVPQNLRGTREGAVLAFTAAMTERMLQTGDVMGVLQGMVGGSVPPTQNKAVLDPSARMTSARSSVQRVTQKPPDKEFQQLRNSWGATDEEIRAIREASHA